MAPKGKTSILGIDLTPEQKEPLQRTTGKDVPLLKLTLEPLEARLAPGGAPGSGVNWTH